MISNKPNWCPTGQKAVFCRMNSMPFPLATDHWSVFSQNCLSFPIEFSSGTAPIQGNTERWSQLGVRDTIKVCASQREQQCVCNVRMGLSFVLFRTNQSLSMQFTASMEPECGGGGDLTVARCCGHSALVRGVFTRIFVAGPMCRFCFD